MTRHHPKIWTKSIGSKASFQAEVYVVGCFCGLQHWSIAVAKTLVICQALFFVLAVLTFGYYVDHLDLFRSNWCVHSNDREAIYHNFLMFCTQRPGPCCSSLLALWSPALARWNSIPMDFWCRRKMWGLGSGFEIEFLRFEMALYIYI